MNDMSSNRSSRSRVSIAVLVGWLLILTQVLSGSERWPYLPNDDIGAYDFKAAHPSYDGRGVVIAILDTGVDGFAPGLLQTSTGLVKIIDVRDFSTEGDWQVELAERDQQGEDGEPVFRHPDGPVLRGAAQLAVAPAADAAVDSPVYIGLIPEERFRNARRVEDLNDDGDSDDRFGFLVYAAAREQVERELGVGRGFQELAGWNDAAAEAVALARKSEKVWLVVVDTDGDGDLTGESILRDYRVAYDTFRLVNDHAPEARTVMAWAVNVRSQKDWLGQPEPPIVEFHFDDGAHGSHCAGIAAGYQVSGQDGMDGVAPGAWLISLKIGDNRLSGGATRTESMKKAYEYAAEFGEKYGVPVVCNMSYGIASVEEGDDAMGCWLDDLLADHPNLYVCTSAGNEGPGLSTIGLPATAASVISSGAYLSIETARAMYNTPLARPTLFTFSSRGGEAAKPDIVSPGSALSSVPGYVDGSARFNGTSMASPQTAGAVACFLSGALQEDLTLHWGMVKRALIAGATRIEGLTLTDQGGGLVAMANSWELLKKLSASASAHKLLGYRIETECPFQADGLSEAAYWRTPQGAPLKPETVTFTVHPIFHPDLTPDEKDTFFRSFRFQSEADWLQVIPGQSYIRGDMGMTVELQYDGRKLREPGAYSARVIASLDGGDLGGLAGREFYLWNTVVIGQSLGAQAGGFVAYEGKDLSQAWIHRYYVEVPAGASALRVRLEVSERTGANSGARARTEICDPEGHVRGGFVGYASLAGEQIKDMTVLAPELYPGTWEINVASSRTAKDLSDYRLTVGCDGYRCQPPEITDLVQPGPAEAAKASLTVTRSFPGVFRGRISASLLGFQRKQEIVITERDEWTHEFSLDRQTPRASFHLEMTEKVANLFTDCAVNILDGSGEVVSATGFDGREVDIGARLPQDRDSADYTLQVVGGFALKEDMQEWGFDVRERYFLADAVTGDVSRAAGGDHDLYCGVPTELDVTFEGGLPAAPDGLSIFGAVRFLDQNLADKAPGDRDGRLVLEVPIE